MESMEPNVVEMVSAIIFWVGGLVMIAAGYLKFLDPSPLARALEAMSGQRGVGALLPSLSPQMVRLIGVGEAAVGIWVLASGGSISAVLMMISYGFFAVVVIQARRSGIASCGCFGQRSSQPSVTHIWVNIVLGVGSAAAIFTQPNSIWDETVTWSLGRWPVIAMVVVLGLGVVALNTRATPTAG